MCGVTRAHDKGERHTRHGFSPSVTLQMEKERPQVNNVCTVVYRLYKSGVRVGHVHRHAHLAAELESCAYSSPTYDRGQSLAASIAGDCLIASSKS